MISIDKKRHLAKTLTWRLVGTLDTIILSWFISGDPLIGLSIGGAEVVTKMTLYYFHERLWFRIPWGIQSPRKVYSEITWEPSPEEGSHEQVAFLEYENDKIRKRVKVTKSMIESTGMNNETEYRAIMSSYNKETKQRLSSIYMGYKSEIERKLNIKIN